MTAALEPRVAHRIGPTPLLPLAVLPIVTALFANEWPSWVFMWAFAFSIYAGLKWLSFASSIAMSEQTIERSLGYVLLWPGMDAKSFFASSRHIDRPRLHEWLLAGADVALGLFLVVIAMRLVNHHAILAGWMGMVGIVFTLHFGLFHLVSVMFRQAGIDATPIMNNPVLASSLSEFWGRRWNIAFRDMAHTFVFRPLVGQFGIAGATMAVFVVSGLIHDAVISIPAEGGYGLPTLYFVIQGVGVLFERSSLGKRLGTRTGVIGRLLCAAVTCAPVVLLFHRQFVERVVVPIFIAIGSIWS